MRAVIDAHRICKSASDRCLVTYDCTSVADVQLTERKYCTRIKGSTKAAAFIALDWRALPRSWSVASAPLAGAKRFLPRLRLAFCRRRGCPAAGRPAAHTDALHTIN